MVSDFFFALLFLAVGLFCLLRVRKALSTGRLEPIRFLLLRSLDLSDCLDSPAFLAEIRLPMVLSFLLLAVNGLLSLMICLNVPVPAVLDMVVFGGVILCFFWFISRQMKVYRDYWPENKL
ncbi:MAG: hypothetical protein IJD21_00060 [Oscillospiraceae bacterium]|nr:hypothetical protein [Oscillospiraceae bacterium]